MPVLSEVEGLSPSKHGQGDSTRSEAHDYRRAQFYRYHHITAVLPASAA